MKVLVFPQSVNPYHDLLYSQIRAAHPNDTISYLPASPRNLILFPFVVARKRLQGYKVFHLHWHTFYIAGSHPIPGRRLLSFVNTVMCLSVLKLLGYRLVWTVHNVLPHEQTTTNDGFITRYTVRLAKHIIIHSRHALQQLRDVGADTSKATVIPHGNYEGVYPVSQTRAQARAQLGIGKDARAILFFGFIRPYKGVEQLLDAYAQLDDPTVRLMVVGQCLDTALDQRIAAFAKAHPSVYYHNAMIPDADVARYFMAADIACMPFTTVTTSGSVLLATTFGKPIVTPYLGAIKDIPKAVGVLYDPSQNQALLAALQEVLAKDAVRAQMAAASAAFSKTLAWDTIAARTYNLYKH